MAVRTVPSAKAIVAVGFIAAAAIAVFASGLLDRLPSTQERIAGLFDGLGDWTYLVAGLLAFLEVGTFVGLLVPSELGVPFAGAAAGESLSFALGRALGRGFLVRHGARVRVTEPRIERIEDYFERHGGLTVLLARFGAYIRTLAPFVAGAAGMRYRNFAPWSFAGCGLWAAALATLGYVFYGSIDTIVDVVLAVGLGVAGVIAAAFVARLVRSAK